MRNNLKLAISCLFLNCIAYTQNDFHNRGTITYEYKINNHKNTWWADDDDGQEDVWKKSYIENTPKFSTYYYTLKFDNNKSLFSYKGRDETIKKIWGDDFKEEDVWYTDFDIQKYTNQKNIFGETFKIEDSVRKVNWKLIPNDVREFAGFNCKKAVGVIYDSVYVFAYYTEAILLNGGPMSLCGLPGTIMGLTIPRMNFSCVANAFTPLVNAAEIIPVKKGKVKQTSEIYKKLQEATKDWGRWAHKGIWQSFL